MMNRFFTLLLAASCLTAFGQVPDYVPTDGLVAWYPLDGNADNASNDNLHGNVDGATPSENRFGVVGQSLFFDGNGDGVFLDHDPVFLSAQQTISLWLQIDEEHFDASTGLGYRLGVLNKTAPGTTNTQNRYFAISMNSEEEPSLQPLGFDVHASTGETYGDRSVASATSPPMAFAQNWYFVCGVFKEDSLFTYVNGDLVATGSLQSARIANNAQIKIGLDYNFAENRDFHGHIDDIGFWNRALEAPEILDLYLAPTPVMGCMDEGACNFDESATVDDGSCVECEVAVTFCGPGTIWDAEMQVCIGDGSGDINLDGCVQLNDLLDLLSAYGNCASEELAWQCGDPLEYQGYDYETVQIGEQCWFAENLRAENYRNGDVIPSDLDNASWSSTEEGAKTFYNFDSTRLETFGMLYNFYATQDSRSLCPEGWHVPSDSEWSDLTTALGGAEVAGNSMKMTVGWGDSDSGTNASGFGGLPGGNRGALGEFSGGDLYGDWWTTDLTASTAWLRNLYRNRASVDRYAASTLRGVLSVLCIKNAE